MKATVLTALAGTLVVAGAANAELVNVTAEVFDAPQEWVDNGYSGLTTYRIYANFTGEDGDGVVAVYGNMDGALTWQSSMGDFFNPDQQDSLTAPADLTGFGFWDNQWDTYVTINVTEDDGNLLQLSPGFGAEVGDLAGNFSTNNAAYFITPADEQGLPDGDNRVLIGQLTLNSDDTFLFGSAATGTGSFTGIQDYNGVQYYVPIIPGPGALALLGLAGLAGTRRRR